MRKVIGSVTQLLRRLKAGQESALRPLAERFWPFLLARAGRKLDPAHRRDANEEDVAQQALWDLYRGLQDGRWRQLADRQDLVAILTQLTECRAINQVKHGLAAVRGGGKVQGESALDGAADSGRPTRGLEAAAQARELPPGEQVLQEDWCRHFLDRLDAPLRPFAEMLLADRTVKEMAAALKCSERTAARKVALIRAKWLQMLAEGG
jgi:hypothetical protein